MNKLLLKLNHVAPFLLIILIIFLFFSKLFFPQPQLFYTPDFGHSDILNFSFPIKTFLSKTLIKGQFPFWSKDIATGFPLIAEGQIGAFNLLNIILFSLLPAWLATNLSYIISFLISFLGIYFFSKKNGLSNLASFYAGFIFTFSGFFVSHISHFNIIQTTSLLPLIFLLTQNLWEKPNKINIFLLAFTLAQQIFFGFPQIVFITLAGISLFVFSRFINQKNNQLRIKKILGFIFSICFGLAIASPQILSTIELTQLSGRRGGLNPEAIFQFPYPFKHLITFIWPDFFGTPKNGSYPPFGPGWGIYWENTSYMGIFPLFLLLFSLIYSFACSSRSRGVLSNPPARWDSLDTSGGNRLKRFSWILLIGSILLVLGKDSPLYFIFSFPCFNLFRVPSRFLLLTAFSIAILAGIGLDQLKLFLLTKFKSKIFILFAVYCLLFTAGVNLFLFGYNYHPLVPIKDVLKPPQSANFIEPQARIYTDPGQKSFWNDFFLKQGWKEIEPFVYFKNSLDANSNIIYNRTQLGFYIPVPTLRLQYYQQALNRKLIDAVDTKYFISPEELKDAQGLNLITKISPPNEKLPPYFIYQNRQTLKRFRFSSNYKVEKTLSSFYKTVNSADFSFADRVILEKEIGKNFEKLNFENIKVVKDEDQKIILQTETDKKSILVIADSFYPGWQAKIDGQNVEILPANLNQRAVIVPPGKHLIEMKYYPKKFYQGLIISMGSLFLFIFLKIPKKFPFFRLR